MDPEQRLPPDDREAWIRETRDLAPLRRRRGRAPDPAGTTPPDAPTPPAGRQRAPDPAWTEFTRGVTPLPDRNGVPESAGAARTDAPTPPPRPTPVADRAEAATFSLNHRTRERLRRGKLQPEARLDLHGMRYADARRQVFRFLQQQHRQGVRLTLIITGRGGPRLAGDPPTDAGMPARGVLRRHLPRWLAEEGLREIVIDCCPAHASHGGDGAFYAYLRKPR